MVRYLPDYVVYKNRHQPLDIPNQQPGNSNGIQKNDRLNGKRTHSQPQGSEVPAARLESQGTLLRLL